MSYNKSLSQFVSEAWPIVESKSPYVHNWHIDVIASHLEAVSEGRIKHILINVPSGTMKTLLCDVFFPAWQWLKKPQTKFGLILQSDFLQAREKTKLKRLINSEWYKAQAPSSFNHESPPIDVRTVYHTIGMRPDVLIVDDPQRLDVSPKQMESDANALLDGVLARLRQDSAFVFVATRISGNDLSGVIESAMPDIEHLVLPMEYDASTASVFDPRQNENELLFTELMPLEYVERCKKSFGPLAYAAQFQQKPIKRNE